MKRHKIKSEMNNNTSDNWTNKSNLFTDATTTAQTVPEYKIRRANFIWPEDPDDEIPMKFVLNGAICLLHFFF